MQKISKVFKEVTQGAKVGDELLHDVENHHGHKNSGVSIRTVKAWADAGLVKAKFEKAGRGQKLVSVKLTGEGKRTAKRAAS